MNLRTACVVAFLPGPMIACTASSVAVDTSEVPLISDIEAMFQNPDGTFEVKCKDGHIESGITANAIDRQVVCRSQDGGTDAAVDSGTDAVVDSGTGAVVDSGTGAVVDSGTDAVVNAGFPFPTCSGAPSFPVTGPLLAKAATRLTYGRDCDAWGKCSSWMREGELVVSPSVRNESTRVSPDRRATMKFLLRSYSQAAGGGREYDCEVTDKNYSVELDASGAATARLQEEDTCTIRGGSGGPRETKPERAVALSMGATCMSIVDVEPTPTNDYGHQRKVGYVVTF